VRKKARKEGDVPLALNYYLAKVELLGTGRNYDPAQRPQSQVTSSQVKSCAKSSQVKSQVKSSQLMSVKSSELKEKSDIHNGHNLASLAVPLFRSFPFPEPATSGASDQDAAQLAWLDSPASKQASSKQASK
jgi:hypothetical protein